MHNIWLVVKHDVGVTLRQKSFWLLAILMPILLVGLQAFALLAGENAAGGGPGEQEAPAGPSAPMALGLVDPAGLMAQTPPGIPAELFVHFPDMATARAALDAGQVQQVVSVPEDYVTSGQVTVYDRGFQLLSSGENMGVAFGSAGEWMLGYILNYNLTGDAQVVGALRNPTPGDLVQQHALTPPPPADGSSQQLAQLVSQIVPYAYYFLLLMGSSYLMRSVVAEKENRTAEVLLLSLEPKQLMVGKIVAMSAILLLQLAIWVGGGALALGRGAELLNLARYDFPPGFVWWSSAFLLLGYLLYASIMAASGAIATNAREGAQVTWLLVLPLLPTLMFGPLLIEAPDSPLVLILSLFPFSAPGAMVTRLAVQNVPLWQIVLSLGLLAATTYVMVTLAARFFGAGNLVSQEAFNWKRFVRGWGKQSA